MERERIEGRLLPSAREWFAVLRERLLASRPVIKPEHAERPGTGGRAFDNPRIVPAVYGKPTFRNVINEKGEHV